MITLSLSGEAAVRAALPVQAARARQLIPEPWTGQIPPGDWLNSLADRIDAENTSSTLHPLHDTPFAQHASGPAERGRREETEESPPQARHSVPAAMDTVGLRTLLDQVSVDATREYGLNSNAFAVLQVLSRGPRNTAEIARAVAVSDAGAAKIFDRLERQGLASRIADITDKRVKTIHLTSRGTELRQQIAARQADHLQVALSSRLCQEDVATFARIILALSSDETWRP